jgi:hypothetical protein
MGIGKLQGAIGAAVLHPPLMQQLPSGVKHMHAWQASRHLGQGLAQGVLHLGGHRRRG